MTGVLRLQRTKWAFDFPHLVIGLLTLAVIGSYVLGAHRLAGTQHLGTGPGAHRAAAAADMGPARPLAIVTVADATDVRSLVERFAELGYYLGDVTAGHADVPGFLLATLPSDLPALTSVELRKTVFLQTILPLVLYANEQVMAERRRLLALRRRLVLGMHLGVGDAAWLDRLAQVYGTEPGDLDTLVRRVDIVPVSLALAQAAEETGWGTSRFAQEGRALFGQWTYREGDGLVPLAREPGKTHEVRIFTQLLDGVKGYVHNLNTHWAYAAFRQERAYQRKVRALPDGFALAETLVRYSERGTQYVHTLRAIIRANYLHRLDAAKLRGIDGFAMRRAQAPDA